MVTGDLPLESQLRQVSVFLLDNGCVMSNLFWKIFFSIDGRVENKQLDIGADILRCFIEDNLSTAISLFSIFSILI